MESNKYMFKIVKNSKVDLGSKVINIRLGFKRMTLRRPRQTSLYNGTILVGIVNPRKRLIKL